MPNGVLTQEMVQEAADAAVLRGHQPQPVGIAAQINLLADAGVDREDFNDRLDNLTRALNRLNTDDLNQAVQDAVIYGTSAVSVPTGTFQHQGDTVRYSLDTTSTVTLRSPTEAGIDSDTETLLNNYKEKIQDLRNIMNEKAALHSKTKRKLLDAEKSLEVHLNKIKELEAELVVFRNYYFENDYE